MGSIRPKPTHLGEKLLRIRNALGLSQSAMLKHLGFEDDIFYNQISSYELSRREPPLMILLQYARVANVWVDVLIDDGLDLPEELPSRAKHEGIARRVTSRNRSKQ
jgi:transcriptional regulator with XRE-family HTH domain